MLTINEIQAYPKQRFLFYLFLRWEKLWWIAADLFAVSCEWGLTLWPFLSPLTQLHVWESHLTNRRHQTAQGLSERHVWTCANTPSERTSGVWGVFLWGMNTLLHWPCLEQLASNYCIDPIRAHTDPDSFTTPCIHISLFSQIYSEVIWELWDVRANRWCVIVGNEWPFWLNLQTLTIIRTLLYINVYNINLYCELYNTKL